MRLQVPEGGVRPRYFALVEVASGLWNQPGGEIAGLVLNLEAALIHPSLPHANQQAWQCLEQLPGGITRWLMQERMGAALHAASDEVSDTMTYTTTLADLRRHAAAVELLEPLLERAPTDAQLCANLASSLRFSNRIEASLPLYRRAIELEPGAVRFRTRLCNALWELGHHSDVVSAYRSIPLLERQQIGFEDRTRVAWSLAASGDGEQANELLRQVEATAFDAMNEHAEHTVGAALATVARARLAASRGDEAVVQSARTRAAEVSPWIWSWLDVRDLLDEETMEVLGPEPALGAEAAEYWLMIEHLREGDPTWLQAALDRIDSQRWADDDAATRWLLAAITFELQLCAGDADGARATFEEFPAWPGGDATDGLHDPQPMKAWELAMISDDADGRAAAAAAATGRGLPLAPLLRGFDAYLRGDVAGLEEFRGLHRSLRLHEPRYRRVPDLLEPRYQAGRNDPCPCGSGAKFKRCHGR